MSKPPIDGPFRGARDISIPPRGCYQSPATDVTTAVLTRFSARAFLPKAVAEDTLRELLLKAARAPSGGNLQPWKIYVCTGDRKDELVGRVAEKLKKGEMEDAEYEIYPDSWGKKKVVDPYRERRRSCGAELYGWMGVSQQDKAGRIRALSKNWEFFDAPVGMIIAVSRDMNAPQWADLGFFLSTLGLLAREQGLHTCFQEAWAQFPKTAAEVLGIPDSEMVFCGVALGYADFQKPVNNLVTSRAPLEEFCSFQGFAKL